ncbi:MAG: hypothetical protein FJX76_09760 [Armatimonadetes bacterium]|nr:hypothetical protein [Armatimonadota bacterium]
MSAVFHLFGLTSWWILSDTPPEAPDTVALTHVDHIEVSGFRETRVADAPRATSAPARVAVALPAMVEIAPARTAPAPRPQPRPLVEAPRRIVNLPPAAPTQAPPVAIPTAAAPAPVTPPALGETPPPPVASTPPPASPTPVASTPAAAEAEIDPAAAFSVVIGYHNDDRIRRDAKGYLVINLKEMSRMKDLRPVLTQVPRGNIPLAAAGQYGLKALDRVKATVKVSIAPTSDPMPVVRPADVLVLDVEVVGRPLDPATRDRLMAFVQEQLSATQWLPAQDRGRLGPSEETFAVEVAQIRDAAMARRVP